MGYYVGPTSPPVAPSERERFAESVRSSGWCSICNLPVGGAGARGIVEHLRYHLTPVECECPGPPPAKANGECRRCRRPQLRERAS